ncbi:hypothetical protein C8R47DRAFT_1216627 [Mycena vitilis]|nr:hypothetical protein C8R47DRAFT_1216627 [Mycena vitilis]
MSLPTFTSNTTAEEVATTPAGRLLKIVVLITGTSINGIGFETARVIAKDAALFIITGYNVSVKKPSKKEVPSANIRQLVLDLSSFATVRKAAVVVNTYSEPIHELSLTTDGIELQIATAHFGPFLFTKLIMPKLLAARSDRFTPRVVLVSSLAHGYGPGVDFGVLKRPDAANLHPGVIPTNIAEKKDNKDDLVAIGALNPDGTPSSENFEWKTIPQGAATTVAAAFDTRLEHKAGAFLVNGCVANDQIAAHSSSPEIAAKLWSISEEIVREKFAF